MGRDRQTIMLDIFGFVCQSIERFGKSIRLHNLTFMVYPSAGSTYHYRSGVATVPVEFRGMIVPFATGTRRGGAVVVANCGKLIPLNCAGFDCLSGVDTCPF